MRPQINTLSGKACIVAKSVYTRITLNRITFVFFIFTFLHAISQTLVQSFLFSVDSNSSQVSSAIIRVADVPHGDFAWLTRPGGGSFVDGGNDPNLELQLCRRIPGSSDPMACVKIFPAGQNDSSVPPGFKRSTPTTQGLQTNITKTPYHPNEGVSLDMGMVSPIRDGNGTVAGVQLVLTNNETIILNKQCTRVLLYADQVLKNSKREELALVGSESWMFSLSFFAIMFDSIPHLIAAIVLRLLSVGWSSYAYWRTQDMHQRFDTLITDGACGIDLFPGYFQDRLNVQVADLVLNIIALLVIGYLTWQLLKFFASSAFKRVGAPPNLVRLYRCFHGVLVCLQLSVFLLIASASLWIDQLITGAIYAISTHAKADIGVFTFTCIIVIPWIATGWFSIRHERKREMAIYLTIGSILLILWAMMYGAREYRWTWMQWPFFACLTVASQLVLLTSIILGFCCWRNFGMGLRHYFYVERALSQADFEHEVFPHDTQRLTRNFEDITVTTESLTKLEAALTRTGSGISWKLDVPLELTSDNYRTVNSIISVEPRGRNSFDSTEKV